MFFFVVRRTDNAFAGVSLDLNIEQTLMASMKGTGGLTHGRTFTAISSLIWMHSRPICSELDLKLRQLTGVDYRLTERATTKHKSEQPSRMKKDLNDMRILEDYLVSRQIFADDMSRELRIMNIATGFVAPPKTNVDRSHEIGEKILNEMYASTNLKKFKIPKKSLAIQIPSPSHSFDDSSAIQSTDPQVFLQRIQWVLKGSEEDENNFMDILKNYELCRIAPALFQNNGFMRFGEDKADLANYLLSKCTTIDEEEAKKIMKDNDIAVVVDGGHLLHQGTWEKNSTFSSIYERYTKFLEKLLGNAAHRVTIVFDDYLESSTKDHIHQKRYPVKSMDVAVNPSGKPLCAKTVFLSNPNNKQQLINQLGMCLIKSGYAVLHSTQDADTMVVNTAMSKIGRSDVILVGDDTDLLIVALHQCMHATPSNSLYMFRSGAVLNVRNVIDAPANKRQVLENILAIHSLSGCDTVSRLSGIGKTRLVKLVEKNPSIGADLKAFSKASLSSSKIVKYGHRILSKLYGIMNSADNETKYEDLRPM